MTDGDQHVDHQTRIEHIAPNCFSRELYKGILGGASHGVFNGKVYVHPNAQKTDGKHDDATRLLLSDEARGHQAATRNLRRRRDLRPWRHCRRARSGAESLPDVARHPGAEAEAWLIEAFIDENIEEMVHEALRDALKFAALKWLGSRS